VGHAIKPSAGELARGTSVVSTALDVRSYSNCCDGWALAFVGGAQYPAATEDRGASWHIAGPRLHIDAAQAALAVGEVGVPSRQAGLSSGRVAFFWGQDNSVVDLTVDGGTTWWRVMLPGQIEFVGNAGRTIFADAYGEMEHGGSTDVGLWQYFTTTGRRWRATSVVKP
jgi:hypothetical protein